MYSRARTVVLTKKTVVAWCLRTYIGLRPYMANVYIKERINDQITICAGGVTSNTTYLGQIVKRPLNRKAVLSCLKRGREWNAVTSRWFVLYKNFFSSQLYQTKDIFSKGCITLHRKVSFVGMFVAPSLNFVNLHFAFLVLQITPYFHAIHFDQYYWIHPELVLGKPLERGFS